MRLGTLHFLISRATAQAFLAASKFMETLQSFGPLDDEIQTKIKYAKWKAVQIQQAIRDGVQHTPGPVKTSSEEEEVLAQLVTPKFESHAHFEKVDAEGIDNESLASPTNAPTLPSVPTGHNTMLKDAHAAVQMMHARGQDDNATQNSGASDVPSASNVSSAPPTPTPTPSAPPASALSAPALPNPTITSSRDDDEKECPLSIQELARVQKLSRWASSALDYEDIDTARDQLREALRILDAAKQAPYTQT